MSIAPYQPLDPALARAFRRALAAFCKSHRALPLADLVRFGCDASNAALAVDFESAKTIGVPVLVLRPARGHDRRLAALSRREAQVARLVAVGARNVQIARLLGISLATVKDHVHRILEKTGYRSRTELAVAMTRNSL